MIKAIIKRPSPLKIINFAAFLQQQRYILPVSFLFYIHNGLTLSDFILFQSIFYFICLLAEIPAGYIGDIFPRKNVLIFSYILFLIRIILWLTMQGYWVILAGEILYGLSKAFYRGVSDGYIYDYLQINNVENKMLKQYGKYNFYISSGSAICALAGAFLYKLYGFKFIFCLELTAQIIAILLLTTLPQIPHVKFKDNSFKVHVSNILYAIKNTLKNSKINYHIYYMAILAGVTSLFVWSFQPLMKSAGVPVVLFGVLYFINHIIRGSASYYAKNIIEKIKFDYLGIIIWISYIFSFLIIILNQNIANSYICFVSLIIVCIAIGIQMVFNVAAVARLHQYVETKTRATSSSVCSLMTELCSGLFLMIYKSLLDTINSSKIFFVFMALFIISIYFPLKLKNRIYK